VKALCNQPEAFALDLSDDQSRYLLTVLVSVDKTDKMLSDESSVCFVLYVHCREVYACSCVLLCISVEV